MLDLHAEILNQRVVFVLFYTLFKQNLQTSHVQLNELNVCFRFENLYRNCFEVVTDLTQTLLLQFHEFLRRCDCAVRTLMRRVLNDRVVNNNRSNNRCINQFDARKTYVSRKCNQSWKCQRLCRHFFFVCYVNELFISICYQFVFSKRVRDSKTALLRRKFWSTSACQTLSYFWQNVTARIWSTQTLLRVNDFTTNNVRAFSRAICNCRSCWCRKWKY
jgi:hypothetical protein